MLLFRDAYILNKFFIYFTGFISKQAFETELPISIIYSNLYIAQ